MSEEPYDFGRNGWMLGLFPVRCGYDKDGFWCSQRPGLFSAITFPLAVYLGKKWPDWFGKEVPIYVW